MTLPIGQQGFAVKQCDKEVLLFALNMRKRIREVLQIVIKTVKFDFTEDQNFVFSTLEVFYNIML